uniref:Uncharacterized protein n=1 Tax=Arundo donax TaxID=35708 RepID=A0A0A9UI37_ARUDO
MPSKGRFLGPRTSSPRPRRRRPAQPSSGGSRLRRRPSSEIRRRP